MLAELASRNGHVETELPEPDLLSHVSVSRLKSFLGCRLRFFFQYVERIAQPISPSLHLGRAIHAGIEKFNRASWRGEDASESAVVTAYQAAFDAPEGVIDWADDSERLQSRDRGETVLRVFLADQANQPPVRPVGVELSVRAEIPGLDLPLVGVIDLIRADNVAVDYKTVAATPDVSLEGWLHDLQLTAYSLLVEDGTGLSSPGNELVFLVKTKSPRILRHVLPPPGHAQRDRFKRLVSVYAEGVSRREFHPSPGMQCGWCSYRAECGAWTGGGS